MIYANHPAELAAWYAARLGIQTDYHEEDGCYYGSVGEAGTPAHMRFGIFPRPREINALAHALMVNYRVDNFDELMQRLAEQRVVIEKVLTTGQGRFAYLTDPEGNPIEIWEEPPGS